MRAVPLIEPLEDRIAPAAVTVAPNGKSASYKDTAGDIFTVTTTKGKFTTGQFIFDPSNASQLTQLTLSGHSDFTGANITFTVTPAAGGTDTFNVGYIDALKLNLGNVTLPGDLGRIDVGGGSGSTMALGKLTVQSLGAEGSATQGGLTTSTLSNITGTVGAINVAGNIDGSLFAQDYSTAKPGTGNIRKLMIGGSLDGNTSTGSGEIFFTGTLGAAFIGGGIEGGAGDFYGSIAGLFGSLSKIGSITVAGSVPDDPNPNPIPTLPGTSILGGAGRLSGGISAVDIGKVYIAGDVFGGTGSASGEIQAGGTLSNITIAGSLVGGNFTSGTPSQAGSSGLVFGANIGSVLIGKDIDGGSGLDSGEILSTGNIAKVTVLGDVAGGSAGTGSSSGIAGAIHGHSIGSVVIMGSLIGGNANVNDPSQAGSQGGAILSDTSIGSIYIAKNVIGGTGPSSGTISTSAGNVGSIFIGGSASDTGSIEGGAGASSGSISINGAIGKLIMTGSLTGASGNGSGNIAVNGAANSLNILGNVTGGTADNTGTISTFGLLKSAYIGGNITGSSSGATKLTNTGYIQANGIGAMTVLGELISGTAGSGGLDTSGAIRSTVSIGSITVGGLVGNATNPAIISAAGRAAIAGAYTSDVAIGTITIKQPASASYATSYGDILAGYGTDTNNGADPLGAGVNADAQIGTVNIAGNLIATNIIAGVSPGANGFGTASSMALSGPGIADLPTIISKISKIIITGQVDATASATDSYGIAAQYIVTASVDGQKLPLIPGPDNDTFAAGKQQTLGGAGGDVVLYEV